MTPEEERKARVSAMWVSIGNLVFCVVSLTLMALTYGPSSIGGFMLGLVAAISVGMLYGLIKEKGPRANP